MSPAFAPDGGFPLALLRGLTDAGVLSVFGGTVFRGLVLPPALQRWPDPAGLQRLDRAQRRLLMAGLLLALLSGFGWLLLQSGAMAGASGPGDDLLTLPTVLRATRFGHLLLIQAGLLVLIAATHNSSRLRPRPIALLPALLLLLLQALHGHAMSMDDAPWPLIPAVILHLLAGGVWIGGLLPLLLVVGCAPPRVAAAAARSFSVWGKACVLLMATTAAIEGWILVGSIPALISTAYGWMAMVKLVLFSALLGFACLNRYRLAPALLRADAAALARRRLLCAIAAQSAAGLAVLLAAGLLADLPPGMPMSG